ncbi:MAG: hypothetical protein ACTSW3_06145 [Promethearchaeota archaeon]
MATEYIEQIYLRWMIYIIAGAIALRPLTEPTKEKHLNSIKY